MTQDGQRVAFVKRDAKGTSHLWIASIDHRTSPQQLASVGMRDLADVPAESGIWSTEPARAGKNYTYTRHPDGTGRKKLLEQAILDSTAVSPDGRWLAVLQKNDADKGRPYRTLAYPNGGGKPVMMCALCLVNWTVDRKYLAIQFGLPRNQQSPTYLLPVGGKSGATGVAGRRG